MELLFDGDIFAYRAASATDGRQYEVTFDSGGQEVKEYHKYKKDADLRAAETGGAIVLSFTPEPESHALHIVKQQISQVFLDLHEDVVPSRFFLSNGGSFRNKLVPSYKMNRVELRRPEHLLSCKQYIVNKYGGISRPGELEADDLLAMAVTEIQKVGGDPVCVSIDKDLKQVPGKHYDFVKKKLIEVSKVEGSRNFYRQLLTGDTSDGIVGIKGMGPKTASKLIDSLETDAEMYTVALREWLKYLKQEPDESYGDYLERVVHQVNLNAQLLYLLRFPGDKWEEPCEENS